MNNCFRVFHYEDATEYQEWLLFWTEWACRDVMAHPDYVSLFAHEGEAACCAIMNFSSGRIILPFILRPLTLEKWTDELIEATDIISPYGYGGPYTEGEVNYESFWQHFDEWAHSNAVVSWFLRLSLQDNVALRVPGEVKMISHNVVCNLSRPIEEVWMNYEHKVRKNVNKAHWHGLHASIDNSGEYIKEFLDIYYSTMDRREASKAYYFPKVFFEKVMSKLKGHYVFFHVFQQERIISSELVLCGERNIYSFLGGTTAEAFEVRPNDFLKHAIIEWGILQGKKTFVLGGGYASEDGIFRYKRAFAPDGVTPFCVSKRIFDAEKYVEFIQKRIAYESSLGNEWNPKTDFFPEYRG